ncbi:hypothetical protein Poli38472_003288 [Pythium oligandrum]|uniref:HECT-type E3 ubiquitin transferase n=1 Tax=Pythium oligandrum TaxID=41045 RepID=A0A8K1C6K1_PYTOL|nr:hypothetical protein Poli38472_003288 [Pythium oligandrum]|eukprot:TMW57363.1 hypothetical protein Poli38472_003288 [Pythium oligandrum]
MTPEDRLFIGLGAAVLLLNLACYIQLRLQKRRWSQLHMPLNPESADLRLDAALREAQAGSIVCSGCGFENFQRVIFCAICGEVIGKLTKRQRKTLGERPAVGDQRRQQRARVRKEWTRKVDEHGKAFWYREGSTAADARFPGWIIRFRPDESTKLAPLTTQAPTDIDASSPSAGVEVVVDSLARRLEDDVKRNKMQVLDASQADPIESLPEYTDSTTVVEYRRLIEHAHQEFPTKLADFITRVLGYFVHDEGVVSRFQIHRESLLSDSIDALASLSPTQVRAPIRVEFIGEQGIDAGGVYREWFLLLNEAIVSPDAGIFTCVNKEDQTFYLNPHSRHDIGEHHLEHFYAAGRLIGRALLEGNVTGFHLSLPLLKIILDAPVSFSDLQYYDPDVYRNLLWLMENDGVEALGLDFSVCERVGDDMVIVDLIPDGRNIAVTDENKLEYLDRKFKYLIFDSVSEQLLAMFRGLDEVIPPELFMLFDAEELDFVLSGSDEIDVDDWERHTKFTPDLMNHPVRQWFWELVREMPNEYRRRLLQFATGSARVPLAGFSALTSYDGRLCPFTLVGLPLMDDGFVRSHACFNRLDVPRHVNKQHLKKGLYAVLETELHGFTIA